MKKFSEFICKHKNAIAIISVILLFLSFIGAYKTRVNYDILVYLPDDIKTIEGQNILTDDFDIGSYAIAVSNKLSNKKLLELEEKIRNIDGVNKVVSIYDVLGTEVPIDMLPKEFREKFNKDDNDIMLITFNDSTSSAKTLGAVKEIRDLSSGKIEQGGMSSMVLDTMELSQKEIFIYIIIAVILCIVILELSLDSYVLPFILLGNIGFAIMYNLGTNVFLGDISYITKSLVAVLQLGVTTDFSIFLYHAYEREKEKLNDNNKAMQIAIKETFNSVVGSSLTTIIGFLVLCTMTLTLGKDLGIVMAKGVLIGVITVLTVFPSFLLIFDKLITKTKHKKINYKFEKLNNLIIKYNKVFLVLFLILLIPFYIANKKVDVYYKLDKSLPDTLESIKTNNILKEKFDIVSPEIILINKNMDEDTKYKISDEISNIEGIDFVLSLAKLKDLGLNEKILPKEFLDIVRNGNYEMMFVNSKYDIATDKLNGQINKVNNILKKYDKKAILAGEGPLMKDLIDISDKDFKSVNYSSIFCIFIVLFFVLKSFSLPFLLVAVIEFAIFVNLGISYLTGARLPFIAPIVLGTIQLGATIDYAILMTNTYLENRAKEKDKRKAIVTTVNTCAPSIFLSGMCFFLSTFGVGVYSKIEMISSLCFLISRGALISMFVVIFLLPSVLLTLDKLIMKTTKKGNDKMKNKVSKVVTACLMGLLVLAPSVSAKEVNKYDHLDAYGKSTTNENKIETKISYKLNGKKATIEEMLGKPGKIQINIKYINKERVNVKINGKYESIYKPYVTVFVTSLNDKDNKNVVINNGNVGTNGKNYSVIGVTIPNLDKSLKNNKLAKYNDINISYETIKFELPTIYNLSIPLNLKDISFKNLDGVYASINELKDNMDKLVDGSNEINEGINLLNTTLKEKLALLKNKNLTLEELQKIKVGVTSEISKTFNNEYQNIIANKAWEKTKASLASSNDPVVSKNVEAKVMNVLKDYLGGEENLGYYAACGAGNTTACVALQSKGYDLTKVTNLKNSLVKEFSTLAKETTFYVGEKVSKEVAKEVSKETAMQISSSLTEKLVPLIFNEVKQEILPSMNLLYTNVVKLTDGSNKFNSSLNLYRTEGINVLYDKSKELNNFTTRLDVLKSINKDESKYIDLIDAVKVKPKEKKVEEVKTKMTFWARIKNLFK